MTWWYYFIAALAVGALSRSLSSYGLRLATSVLAFALFLVAAVVAIVEYRAKSRSQADNAP